VVGAVAAAKGYGVRVMREGPRSVKILNQMPPKNSRAAALEAAHVVLRAMSARWSSFTSPRCGVR